MKIANNRMAALALSAAFIFMSCGNASSSESSSSSKTRSELDEELYAPSPDDYPMTAPLEVTAIDWSNESHVGDASAVCSIRVEWPYVASAPMLATTRQWVNQQLLAPYYSAYNNELLDGVEQLGSRHFDSMDDYVAALGEINLEQMTSDLHEFADDGGFPDMRFEFDQKIVVNYMNDNLVTYLATLYQYMGGAHGGTVVTPATFFFPRGEKFTVNSFEPSAQKRLLSMIKSQLDREYGDDAYLFDGEFSFPQTDPYIHGDSIYFVYQQYEIMPYAYGMPTASFNIHEVASMLTPEAAQLIGVSR